MHLAITGTGATMDTLKDKIKGLEREAIIEALRESNWVMAQAARKLGITERMIGYKIKKYGLRIKEVRWIEDTQQTDSDQDRGRHN
jgi:Nif-specific regulatory protein